MGSQSSFVIITSLLFLFLSANTNILSLSPTHALLRRLRRLQANHHDASTATMQQQDDDDSTNYTMDPLTLTIPIQDGHLTILQDVQHPSEFPQDETTKVPNGDGTTISAEGKIYDDDDPSVLTESVQRAISTDPRFWEELLHFDFDTHAKVLERIARDNKFNPDTYSAVVEKLNRSSATTQMCSVKYTDSDDCEVDILDIKVFLQSIEHFVKVGYPVFLRVMEKKRQLLQHGRAFGSKSQEIVYANVYIKQRAQERERREKSEACKIEEKTIFSEDIGPDVQKSVLNSIWDSYTSEDPGFETSFFGGSTSFHNSVFLMAGKLYKAGVAGFTMSGCENFWRTCSTFYGAVRDIGFARILAQWDRRNIDSDRWREGKVRLAEMLLRKIREEKQ